MCPDNKLLSAFYDGEVSSPWKEQLEEHLSLCESCRAVIDDFTQQSQLLHEAPEPSFTSRYADLEHMIRQRNTVSVSSSFWSGVKWPAIPVAAAAAAVIAFFMGFIMVPGDSGPAGSYMSPPLAVSEGWSIPQGDLTVSGEDLNEFLSLLEPPDSQLFDQESSLDLPVDLNLDFYGDSQLLKPANLRGGPSR